MASEQPGLFRPEAVQRHRHGRDQSVLPRFVSPPVFLCLWLLVGLLAAGGILAWLTPVPVVVSGRAVVVDTACAGVGAHAAVAVVAFLPAEELDRVHVGQVALLRTEAAREPLRRTVTWISPHVVSPDAAATCFGLRPGVAATLTQPVAVAMADLDPPPGDLAAAQYVGSVYGVDVEVGSTSAAAFIPLIVRLVGA